ncbi:nucleoside hydrolase [Cohnella silvisoli]|uniref:Nucleoside hydrolase n=1 Tax=Cohnella silvisoli TaxID=2873699 RepID=A0ABV1KVX2_9BACL|nr:nucleoside hydrolase [Cohnella silvisoli]MCD9023590.1 nucleoside hydrolase [Cohnella silvisoli]
MPNNIVRVIIDVDTGIDDALTILYALKSKEIRVEGITTVFGNIDVDQATDNTLRIIQLADPGYDVPVARGADRPYKRSLTGFADSVHGENGIGNVKLPPASQTAVAESAAEFIVRMVNENPGEIVLVATGRMTNLAFALKLDEQLPFKVKSVAIMGGTVHAPGNVTPVAEANFWGDPEAADAVMQSGLPITMVGLDVTMRTHITQQHLDLLNRFGKEENKAIIAFMQQSLAHYFGFYTDSNNYIGSAPMHDPLTLLVAVDPGLVKTQTMKVSIDCGDSISAGMVVADLRTKPSMGRDIQVCVDVDAQRAERQFLSVFM